MRFDQTGEVLHYVERFYHELAEAYAELAPQLADRRSRMLLEYMSEREEEAAEAVHQFAHGSKDPSLKEWDPFTINESAIRMRIRDGLHAEASADELLGLGLEVTAWLEGLFMRLEAKSGTEEQKALFANMRARAEREKQKLARNANMLLDF
jgi:hypothetical protein